MWEETITEDAVGGLALDVSDAANEMWAVKVEIASFLRRETKETPAADPPRTSEDSTGTPVRPPGSADAFLDCVLAIVQWTCRNGHVTPVYISDFSPVGEAEP